MTGLPVTRHPLGVHPLTGRAQTSSARLNGAAPIKGAATVTGDSFGNESRARSQASAITRRSVDPLAWFRDREGYLDSQYLACWLVSLFIALVVGAGIALQF